MSIERLWTLVARKLAEEASADELNELSALLADHSDLHLQLEAIMTAWNGGNAPDKEEQEESYQLLLSLLRKNGYGMGNIEKEIPLGIEFASPRKRNLLKWGIGSVIVMIAFIAFYLFLIHPKKPIASAPIPEPTNIISTKNGSRTKIELPDGSTAWLNAGSKLIYDKQFGNKVREVELSGEAFFDVRHDDTKPFIIRTSFLEIKDLGTQFNVKCYPDDKTSEVSLVNGSVEVTMKKRSKGKWVLMPNEKVSFLNEPVTQPEQAAQKGNKVPIQEELHLATYDKVNFDKGEIQEVAWTKNKLAFIKERLDVMTLKLERWFDRKVVVQTPELNSLKFTATFEAESLEYILKALQLSAGKKMHFTIEADKVIIY